MKRIMMGIITFSLVFSFVGMPVVAEAAKTKPVFEKMQVEKSKEEKQNISRFIQQYRYFDFGDVNNFDCKNPDQKVMLNFMEQLLGEEPNLIKSEVVGPKSKYYELDNQRLFNRRYKEEDVNRKFMELFGSKIDFSKKQSWQSDYVKERGHFYVRSPQDGTPNPDIEIKNTYSLGNDLIYVQFDRVGVVWNRTKEQYDNDPGHVILNEVMKNGKKSYELIKYSTNMGELSDEKLSKYSRDKGPLMFVNGKILRVSAAKKDDRVLVPLRAIFEALDAQVTYDSETKVITGTRGDTVVTLTLDKKEVLVGDTRMVLDVPAQVINGATVVPVRFIGESLGAEVLWEDNTVIINSKK